MLASGGAGPSDAACKGCRRTESCQRSCTRPAAQRAQFRRKAAQGARRACDGLRPAQLAALRQPGRPPALAGRPHAAPPAVPPVLHSPAAAACTGTLGWAGLGWAGLAVTSALTGRPGANLPVVGRADPWQLPAWMRYARPPVAAGTPQPGRELQQLAVGEQCDDAMPAGAVRHATGSAPRQGSEPWSGRQNGCTWSVPVPAGAQMQPRQRPPPCQPPAAPAAPLPQTERSACARWLPAAASAASGSGRAHSSGQPHTAMRLSCCRAQACSPAGKPKDP